MSADGFEQIYRKQLQKKLESFYYFIIFLFSQT